MSSVPYDTKASWTWPKEEPEEHIPAQPVDDKSFPGAFTDIEEEYLDTHKEEEQPREGPPQSRRHYSPRTCRICLEVVQPTFEPITDGFTSRFNPAPKVSYISSEPELGRLIRPCKCRGSSRYVHEGCLNQWRIVQHSTKNYWQCPTCNFKYKLNRLKWSAWIQSTTLQIFLTVVILLGTIFILGFIADPIINIYLDPYDTITSIPTKGIPEIHLDDDDDGGWAEHFAKGLASLGLLGMIKAFFVMSPWQWWNIRTSGLLGGTARGRRGGTGRERMENISWTLVLIGVMTFLYGTWKFVRGWSRRTLEIASDRVVDVQGEDDDFEEEPVPPTETPLKEEASSSGVDSETASRRAL
ncbi:hypothetical protein B0O99DRAFT_683127 [Bisporella sp. PMI_857]|nr:hypothetical protein B0O99DRAFT_683127 [Bisporella sp. PMI_857]